MATPSQGGHQAPKTVETSTSLMTVSRYSTPSPGSGQAKARDGAGEFRVDSAHTEDPITQEPVLGIPVFAGTLSDAAQLVVGRAATRAGGYVCLSGAHLLTMARRRSDVRTALQGSWMNFPDGAPVAWVQRMAGVKDARRVAGTELMLEVLASGTTAGVRHFLFGSTPDDLDRIRSRVLSLFPDAHVTGVFSPPFRQPSSLDDAVAIQAIQAAEPHIVWVGLGAPKQELWMQRNAASLGPILAIGVGAAFDFISGNKPRAPIWMQRAGLEWLHRMSSEPRRLVPRYVDANGRFVAYLMADLARGWLDLRRR